MDVYLPPIFDVNLTIRRVSSSMGKTYLAIPDIPPGDLLLQVPEGPFTSFSTINEYIKYIGTEKMRFSKDFNRKSCSSSDISQFDLIKTLGRGAFGTIFLVKSKKTNSFVAMKVLSKDYILAKNIVHQVLNEKRVMASIKFNFVLSLIETFIDNSFIYFVMPYMSGGDLLAHLNVNRRFDEHLAKFYVAQVVLALEYLHGLKIIHRDVKPENLSLDQRGYVRLLDFGLSKVVVNRTNTFCGTPEYIAPEIILGQGYNCSVDWWALGILSYQLVAGVHPFYASSQERLFHLITNGDFAVREFFSQAFAHFIEHLISVDIGKRAGCGKGGAEEVRKLKWLSDTNWLALLNKKVPVSYKPQSDLLGLGNFQKFKEEPLVIASQNLQRDAFGDF